MQPIYKKQKDLWPGDFFLKIPCEDNFIPTCFFCIPEGSVCPFQKHLQSSTISGSQSYPYGGMNLYKIVRGLCWRAGFFRMDWVLGPLQGWKKDL
jgi:hypothetical protein